MNKKLLPNSLDLVKDLLSILVNSPPGPEGSSALDDLKLKYRASYYALEDDDECCQEEQKENVKMEGVKYDNKKPDYSLIPPNALESIAKVMTHGAQKYDRHNWKKLDNPVNRYFAAAQRHLWAVKKGEDLDPESGEHHYAHALCCIMYLLEFYSLQNDNNSI